MKPRTKRELKAALKVVEKPAAPVLQSYPDRVVPECVSLAKNLLADCEAGRIKAMGVGFVTQNDQTASASAVTPNNPTQAHILCAAVSKLNWAFNRALVG